MGEWSQVHPVCRRLPVSTRLGVLWSPHYLVMQLTGSEHSEASLKPQITHLVLNLPQANTGITGEIQERVYLTCNLKELPVLEPAQANTLLHKPNLYFHGKSVRRWLRCRTVTVYRQWGQKSSPRLTPAAEL